MLDIDDTIIEVHSAMPSRLGYGYSGVRGLNALLATVCRPPGCAPVVVAPAAAEGIVRFTAQREAAGRRARARPSPRCPPPGCWCAPTRRSTGIPAGRRCAARRADVSVTVRLDPRSRPPSPPSRPTPGPRSPTDTVFDERTRWVPAGRGRRDRLHRVPLPRPVRAVPGRLVVRRIPDLNPGPTGWAGHPVRRLAPARLLHHHRPRRSPVTADKIHRGHAIVGQVHSDLKDSALAHLPSGKFDANSAWLVLAVIAFNLTRAAATLTGPTLATSPPRPSAARSSASPHASRPPLDA